MKVRIALLTLLLSGFWFISCQFRSSDQIIFINNSLKACDDYPAQQCLQIKLNEAAEWTDYSGSIEAFEFEEGYYYKLKVSKETTEHTSLPSYKLVAILEQSKTPLTLDEGFWLVVSILDYTGFARNPVFRISNNTFIGNTSCNKFSGTIKFDADNFKARALTTTKMTCPTLAVEDLFLDTLQRVDHYKISGDSLWLMDRQYKKLMSCIYFHE